MSSLPPTLDFPATEQTICDDWKKNDTFRMQNKLSLERGDEKFTFYDGPPFATGLPHYGHILAGTIKDTVTRYACMSGKYVERRAGWDCHGLPVEYEIDQKLDIKHRDQVLEMGIDKYNATCRSIVTRYTAEWESTINRLGRWIDFENDYKTMDATFMESVWWVFSQLHQKGLVYQGYKVMPYSTACTTPLSNFEAGLNYKDVKDPAVVVSFPLLDDSNASFVAWTTTPWTLPSNLALCVNAEMDYVKLLDKKSDHVYILAKSRLAQLYPAMNSKKWKPSKAAELYEILAEFKGATLVGQKYKPLFDFFKSDSYFTVVADSYVTDDAGTGVVHQAPAFGEDDYRVCLAAGIIQKGENVPCPVDDSGLFTEPVEPVKGVHVKQADPTLIQLIKDAGRLVQKDVLNHSYPFCWRSDTPLIYKAVPSWFIKVEEIRDQIVENNKQTYWVPAEVKEGRFHNWLQDARDWAVSRNRFWGTPIPIWANEDLSEVVCIGSIAELEEKTGKTGITDLHRESIDDLEIPSQKEGGAPLRRVPEVFDCWFESGSMPYAQSHYPFENKDEWEKGFPADFIAEGLDQTRGWFYTLMVLSTALFDRPAFKNNIVNGMVLAADGQKMSKRKKNYPDPVLVINKYGADALRMYLINSPVVRAEPLKFKEEGVLGVVKEVFLPLYNAFRFFLQNVERWEMTVDGNKFVPDLEKVLASKNPTDHWIQAETARLIQFVHEEMKSYRLYTVMPALVEFGNQLTNWYVRLNRERLKGLEEGDNPETGLQVLYNVLMDVITMMAPCTPFLTEFFYQNLRKFQPSYPQRENGGGTANPVEPGKSDSIHFLRLPDYDPARLDEKAVQAMHALQSIVEQGRNAREKRNISLKFPIKQCVAILRNPSDHVVEALTGPLQKYILSELNTWSLLLVPAEDQHDWVTLSLSPNYGVLGKRLRQKMKAVQAYVRGLSHDEAVKCLEEGKLEVEGEVLDAKTDLESKLEFSCEGDHWEATSKGDGSLVVAVDCTQDSTTRLAGMSREVLTGIQQLRKAAGLDLKDIVEVFFQEENSDDVVVEKAVAANLAQFQAKGAVPLPKKHAPTWSVVLKSGDVEVGGIPTQISIHRPAVAVRDDLDEAAKNVLQTFEPSSVKEAMEIEVDGKKMELKSGTDFWKSTADKLRDCKTLSWLN